MAEDKSQSAPVTRKQFFLGIGIIALIGIALAPVYPTETTYPVEEEYTEQVPREVERQADVEYQILSSDVSGDLSSQVNQFLGVGSTTLQIEIRNTDSVGGQFTADIQCQASSGNSVSLDASQYINSGEVGTLEATADSQLESCDQTVTPPQKTVTETVMREVTKTRTVTKTKTVNTNLINYLTNQ